MPVRGRLSTPACPPGTPAGPWSDCSFWPHPAEPARRLWPPGSTRSSTQACYPTSASSKRNSRPRHISPATSPSLRQTSMTIIYCCLPRARCGHDRRDPSSLAAGHPSAAQHRPQLEADHRGRQSRWMVGREAAHDATGVVTVADAVDKGAVGFKADEISALPPPEPLVEADLDMAVGRLDAPVLIGHARIITGRLHAVMPAQLVITLGEIELCVAVEIFEGGRQRVGPMLPWDASELPKRILQPLGDG